MLKSGAALLFDIDGTLADTDAPRENAVMTLDGLRIGHRFKALICGEELAHGKPHPMPYLEGLKALGASAGRRWRSRTPARDSAPPRPPASPPSASRQA
jgi:beta-phosphoglucomutase-like phosphatase (HAD superfamily)